MKKTHVASAVALSVYLHLNPVFLISGSLFPDIDIVLARYGLGKHRGFLHSIIASMLFSTIIYTFLGSINATSFLTGYLAHLLLDSMTRMGVPFFAPFSTRRIRILDGLAVKTGGIADNLIFLLLIFLAIRKFI